jgi:uncharacterized Fe-S center protein
MASEVFYMNDRANALQESLTSKAVKLFRDAGLGDLFKPGDTVGVKIHMGEYGSTGNLRPQLVRAIVEEIRRLKGKPVVVDCTTMPFNEYTSRGTAKDMLWTATRHGLTEETLTCPIWVGDGEYGFDEVKVEVPHGTFLKHSYMGAKLLDLDAMIAVTHFKGHPMGVFGGALKNIGIGCGSKKGKICTHLLNHPQYGRLVWTVNPQAAEAMTQGPSPTLAERLERICPFGAMAFREGGFETDVHKCHQCVSCFSVAMFNGLVAPPPEIMLLWALTIPDAFSAYVNAIGKDKVGYLTYGIDVSPWCDCVNYSDRSLVPNLGVFASKDPVAIDMACLEMAESFVATPGSKAEDLGFGDPGTERFTNLSSMAQVSQWAQIHSAIYNGLGTSEYELVVSQPGPETDYWPEMYSVERPWSVVNRNGIRGGNWELDLPYTFDEARLSLALASLKPKGKAGEREL